MANKTSEQNSNTEGDTSGSEDKIVEPGSRSFRTTPGPQGNYASAQMEECSDGIQLESLRASVVARLHQLEVATQQLSREKRSLEHQLMHVLEHLVSETSSPSGMETAMRRTDARQLILQIMGDARPQFCSFRETSDKAPIAKPDYSGLRETLAESSSAVSVGEYSSLSDAYEAICLQKDMVSRMITSESSRFSDKQATHDIVAQEGEGAATSRQRSDGLTTSGLLVKKPGLGEPNLESDTEHKGFREAVKQITTKEARGTTSVETLRAVKTHFPLWLSSREARARADMRDIPGQFSRDTDSVRSSLDSCSIFSSSPSSSSPPPHSKSCVTPLPSKRLSSSMPASPLSSVENPNHGEVKQQASPGGPTRSATYSSGAHKITSRMLDTVYSRTQVGGELSTTARRLRTLTSEIADLNKAGPPKVRISRRKIVHTTNIEDSSDTSTTSHRMPMRVQEAQRMGRTRGKNEKPLHESYKMMEGKRVASPLNIYRTPESRIGAAKPYPTEISSNLFEGSRTLPIQLGPYTDFLHSPIAFGQYLPSSTKSLYEAKDLMLLRMLSKLISGLDSFTCNHCGTLLLERVQPPFPCPTPILFQDSNNTVNHSHESSDLTSEFSVQTGGVWCAVTSEQLPFRDTSAPVYHGVSPVDTSPPKQGQMTIHRIKWEGNGSGRKDLLDQAPKESYGDDNVVQQREIVFRLSNRVKIWRRYQAELSSSSLLLYATDSTVLIHSPKRCIALADVQNLRKQHNFSASITMGLASPGMIDRERPAKYRIGSVPVTRKFSDVQPELGRTRCGHFELVMRDGKTHRFKGIDHIHTDAWIRKIRRALRAVRAAELVEKFGSQLVAKGWLRRIKGSEVNWVWCRLMGQYLIYAQRPDSLSPTGYKSLENTHIRTMSKLYSPVRLHDALTCPTGKLETTVLATVTSTNTNQLLTSSSDSDTLATGDADVHQRTISLWTENCDPVYLVCHTQNEFENWRDHLIRACQHTIPNASDTSDVSATQTKLLDQWRSLVRPEHVNTPYHTNELIRSPLSKTTEILQTEHSKQLFACLLFLSYPKVGYQKNIEEFVRLPLSTLFANPQWLTMKHRIIQHLSSLCLTYPGLKDELFLQLIKQATLSDGQSKRLLRRQCPQRDRTPLKSLPFLCGRRRSPTSSSVRGHSRSDYSAAYETTLQIDSVQRAQLGEISVKLVEPPKLLFPPPSCTVSTRPDAWWSLISVWECLCLLLPLFLPSLPVLTCLQLLTKLHSELAGASDVSHLAADIYTELSRYAAFCNDALKQTLTRGGRLEVPSALEVASISIRNPYTHTYPFSIPIHLPNGGAYEVVSFNGGSELRSVTQELASKLKLPIGGTEQSVCLYSLYLRVTSAEKPTRYLYLEPSWKLCDVISLYEQAMLNYYEPSGSKVTLEEATAELTFRIQAFSWKRLKMMQAREAKPLVSLIMHQLHGDLLSGSYVVVPTGDKMLDMVAYMCRADHFEYTELQRRKEMSLSQLVTIYFPPKWISDLAEDGRSIIQLKLLLIDRWSYICKTDVEVDSDLIMWDRIGEAERIERAKHALTEVVSAKSCFAYLRLLRDLLPERFGTISLPARVHAGNGFSEHDIVWIVPQESQLNFMSNSIANMEPGAVSKKPSQPLCCIKIIPYHALLSFGGLPGGSFFLVYYDSSSSSKDWRKRSFHEKSDLPSTSDTRLHYYSAATCKSPKLQKTHFSVHKTGAGKVEQYPLYKLRIYLTDLNSVTELTSTLEYFINLSKKKQ